MTVIVSILWVITVLLGIFSEPWRGRYSGNSDMVRSSAQFWFYIFMALSVLFTAIKLIVS